jgi:hypothetical protein
MAPLYRATFAKKGENMNVTRITKVFENQKQGLPLSQSFPYSGGTLLIFASGSLKKNDAALRELGMDIKVNGKVVGTAMVNTESTDHVALSPALVSVPPLQVQGQLTLDLTVHTGNTITTNDDYYNATVIEMA